MLSTIAVVTTDVLCFDSLGSMTCLVFESSWVDRVWRDRTVVAQFYNIKGLLLPGWDDKIPFSLVMITMIADC